MIEWPEIENPFSVTGAILIVCTIMWYLIKKVNKQEGDEE